ncbi:VWA domain-containing protein [Gordonia sp. HY002]|uniref:vWA domain-containing protein n=1 Tax=Gordonia zhenghanii TaxID=2911516 RepID=UPI001EF09EE1|nr:VWA domain-containing protein [Gordonia zhenghanii]MCF8572298.1 VWA domain-containing protein [Gordonia zhenghanii]MCF8605995.1 VWA domain-containing protein [Gordonia zhenghanii]
MGAEAVVDTLTGFVEDLRGRGITVGPSNLIDAGQAMTVLDLLDRESLREGLAATLLSDHNHRDTFDLCFELWFPLGNEARRAAFEVPRDADGEVDVEALREMVADTLADPEATADGRFDQMVAAVVAEMGRYDSARGESYSVYQAMSQVSPQTLIARIAAAMAGGQASDGDRPGTDPLNRRAARGATERFREAVTTETQRRMAEIRGRDAVSAYAVPKLPENIDFFAANAQDMIKMRRTIDPIARLLAAKLEFRRRRNRHAAVDVRATLRASMSTGGVPIDLRRRKPRPGKPELIIICDVSGSVAGFSQFTLQLVYALRQQFSNVRVFAFVDTVDEVTDFFAHGNDDTQFGARMSEMLSTARISTRDGHSDYGHMLKGFARTYLDSLTHRSALLILGDARNNFRPAHADSLAKIRDRVRNAYWLNPERRQAWDSGDSSASVYAAEVDMFECRNADQLGRVIADLLPV